MGGHRRVNGLEERSSALEMRGAKLPRVGNSGSGSSLGGTSGRCTQAELTDWMSEGGVSLVRRASLTACQDGGNAVRHGCRAGTPKVPVLRRAQVGERVGVPMRAAVYPGSGRPDVRLLILAQAEHLAAETRETGWLSPEGQAPGRREGAPWRWGR